MALRISHADITKDGKLIVIFSGGGRQVWYPTTEELDLIQKWESEFEDFLQHRESLLKSLRNSNL